MSELIDYRIKPGRCPNCGRHIDAAAGAGGRRPQRGDVMVCMTCSHVSIWDRGRLRDPNDAEMHDIAGDPEMIEYLRVLALAKADYEAENPGKKWSDR